MNATGATPTTDSRPTRRRVVVALAVLVLVGAIAVDTTVVRIGSESDLRQQAFDPDRFGQIEFPRIRDLVIERAPDAIELASQLEADKNAAISDHGTMAGGFPVLPVRLTGTVGEGNSGIFNVSVEGMAENTQLRVQTGPAINGTELRDISGDIAFGDFTNQIEYQNVGAGLNRAMAAEVLSGLDRDTLSGKTVNVVGVFTLINPANWLITPVAFEVEP